MSVRFVEGFDFAGTVSNLEQKWSITNSATGLSLVTGRAGGSTQALRFAAAQTTTKIARPLGKSGVTALGIEFVFGMAIRFSQYPTNVSDILQLSRDATGNEGNLCITPQGSLGWRLGSTMQASTIHTLGLDVWHYVEVRVEIRDTETSGISLTLRIDGHAEFFGDLANPANTSFRTIGTDPVDSFRIGMSVDLGTFDIDDFYQVDPNDAEGVVDFLGDRIVSTLIPNGDGNTTAWTRFDGSNDWESVDEGLGVDDDGDTTYLHSQTEGEQSLFTFTNLPAEIDTIDVVAVNVVGKKHAAGGAGFHPVKRTSATTEVGALAHQAGQGSYVSSQAIHETDGADAAWTAANVDASEFGMEVES